LQWDWLTQEDRAHLDEWMKKKGDASWDKLAAAITAHGEFSHSEPLSLAGR
jgi:hypothetical protein